MKIKDGFTHNMVDPMKILKKLRPRVENDLVIPPITIKETEKLFQKLKTQTTLDMMT